MARVAVLEDEELIRTMLKLNLEKAGYGVRCFNDAESMLAAVDSDFYDLFLMDVKLPGMPGVEALKRIRLKNIKTPAIMVTSKNDIETKSDSFQYGADDYISKPFNMKELLMRVKAVIRRSQGERSIPSERMIKNDK